MVVAAGDTGAAGCDSQSALMAQYGQSVVFPAAVPSFVAVGGTQLQLTASNQSTYLDAQLAALSYIPESAWNETLEDIDGGYGGLGAGGGGPSRLFAKPSWQVPYTPNDGFRDVPDVALSASADVLPYAVSMSWTAADGDAQAPQPQALTAYGGTSVATPAFAGILALINQAVAEANPGVPVGLGNANPILYALANNASVGERVPRHHEREQHRSLRTRIAGLPVKPTLSIRIRRRSRVRPCHGRRFDRCRQPRRGMESSDAHVDSAAGRRVWHDGRIAPSAHGDGFVESGG